MKLISIKFWANQFEDKRNGVKFLSYSFKDKNDVFCRLKFTRSCPFNKIPQNQGRYEVTLEPNNIWLDKRNSDDKVKTYWIKDFVSVRNVNYNKSLEDLVFTEKESDILDEDTNNEVPF